MYWGARERRPVPPLSMRKATYEAVTLNLALARLVYLLTTSRPLLSTMHLLLSVVTCNFVLSAVPLARLYHLFSHKYIPCASISEGIERQKISPTRFELVTLRLSNYSLTLFQLSYGEFGLSILSRPISKNAVISGHPWP